MSSIFPGLKHLMSKSTAQAPGANSPSTPAVTDRDRSDSFEIIDMIDDSADIGASSDNYQFPSLAKSFFSTSPSKRDKGNGKAKVEDTNATVLSETVESSSPERSSSAIPVNEDNNDDGDYGFVITDADDYQNQRSEDKGKGRATAIPDYNDDDTATEPFPDYYASCEGPNAAIANPLHEAAYDNALSKVAEAARASSANNGNAFNPDDEDVMNDDDATEPGSMNLQSSWQLEPEFERVMAAHREVIASSPRPATREAIEARILRKFTEMYDDDENKDNIDSEQTINQLVEASQTLNAGTFVDGVYRGQVLNEYNNVMANTDIPHAVWQRFSFMSNTVLRMNHAMFHSHKLVLERDYFLAGPEKIEVREMADSVRKYIDALVKEMEDLANVAHSVDQMLCDISKDETVAPSVMFRRMARVAAKNLRKTNPLEKHLLFLLAKLYDSYVYQGFSEISSRHALPEYKSSGSSSSSSSGTSTPSNTQPENQNQNQQRDQERRQKQQQSPNRLTSDPQMKKLHKALTSLSNVLNKAVDDCNFYTTSLDDFKEAYVRPVASRMNTVPAFTKADLLMNESELDDEDVDVDAGDGDGDGGANGSENEDGLEIQEVETADAQTLSSARSEPWFKLGRVFGQQQRYYSWLPGDVDRARCFWGCTQGVSGIR